MTSKKETFASLMDSFTYRYDLRTVFDDLLTMYIYATAQIPGTGKSHYEDLYLEIAAKYEKDDLRTRFPKALAQLIMEMEERVNDSHGNDVLGEYYQQNFCKAKSGQFFTPWPLSGMLADLTCGNEADSDKVQQVIDPSCGSGRMLMTAAKRLGWGHEYYGIDVDHTCVKMTALNLFLNGIFHAEVMCANALDPNDFRISYKLSFLPLGIFRIEEKERSRLWQMNRNAFTQNAKPVPPHIISPSEETKPAGNGSQLRLF